MDKGQLANQVRPRNHPNFTHPISAPNSNMPSTNNNNARGYLIQFNTTITFAQPPVIVPTDQGDPMDLSASKGPRKPFTPEEKKYRFDNNLCLYCGKPGHRIMDHKKRPNKSISLHQFPLLRHRQQRRLLLKFRPFHNNKKKFKLCIQSFARANTTFYFCFNFNTSKFGGNFK